MNQRIRPRGFPFRDAQLPWPGLVAYAVLNKDGSHRTTRRGAPDITRVTIEPDAPAPGTDTTPRRPEGLTDSQWNWITEAPRKWATLHTRLGPRAEEIILALVHHHAVRLECEFEAGRVQLPPLRTIPHEDLRAAHHADVARRRDRRADLATQATHLADALHTTWPGVAAALDLPDRDPRLFWAVAAAGDLLEGRSHDGPRAFVQHHVPHRGTKAREDIRRLLTDLGWEPEALVALGVNRAPYLGLGGRLTLTVDGHPVSTGPLPGPHSFRLTAGHHLTLRAARGTRRLVVIENRQAAEAVCDTWPEEAVIWCQGQLADLAVALIVQAAHDVPELIVCPDADLGGVRIAARIIAHLPSSTAVQVLDVGTVEHPVGKPFSEPTRQDLRRLGDRTDAAGTLARACLARGHVVEQEGATRQILRHALGR